MKGLSKSRYTAFCQCPKNLWLKVYKPNEATIDAGLQARFAQGNVVGDLAMGLFGDFKEAHAEKADGSLNLSKMVEQTRQWMDECVENICEASFICEGGYCAVDILRKTNGGWAIYEVKSTSFPEFNGQEAKLEKYAPDIAYQKWVLEQCGVNVTGTYLVCLNSDYVRHGELDIEQLFVVNDMKEMVENESLKVPARVSQAMKVINNEQEPDTELSECCMKPYGCAFWEYCKRQHGVPSPSVFDIYGGKGKGGFTFKKKLDCYHQGLIAFEDLRSTDIGPIQNMQIEAALTGREFINSEGIRKFLNKLSYPLYFLDFETMQDAVPQYDGAKVYAQITFQYSLHIKQNETAAYEHREFLASSDGSDPRRALAEQLCKDIPKDVCTLAYNKMFECGRIRELAALYPDLSDHLLNIADNIKDLIDPFRAGDYYVPAMGGSFSIKSVLPALFPNDPELDYHNLDKRCQNGGDAMNIFPRLQQLEQSLPKQGVQNQDGQLVMADSLMPLPEQIRIREEIAASRKALLDYCKLDTWAMVKVWEKLNEVAE
ncbi:MAG: DUF2779 domain-containing protein [Bacteroidaceae bacterium]|nr:DUF2779 domain-containing protein [Bacteroidaceae bacterium]